MRLCVCWLLSRVRLFAIPQTEAQQAPPFMGFSRQEHWSELPFPFPKGTIERKKVKSLSRVRLFASPWTVAYQALGPWIFPGKSTGVGCHFLLQGIFLTQGSNPGLPHCRQMLYPLSHQGSPVILEQLILRPFLYSNC